MKTARLKRSVISVFVVMALAVSSFAAPLCACLNVTAKSHDCCEKMKEHCPMKRHQASSLDKAPHSGCACSVEKRENTPAKISDNGKAQQEIPALTPNIPAVVFTARAKAAIIFFIAPLFTGNPHLKQTSARAPPCL
jgi:hypothetical protein